MCGGAKAKVRIVLGDWSHLVSHVDGWNTSLLEFLKQGRLFSNLRVRRPHATFIVLERDLAHTEDHFLAPLAHASGRPHHAPIYLKVAQTVHKQIPKGVERWHMHLDDRVIVI